VVRVEEELPVLPAHRQHLAHRVPGHARHLTIRNIKNNVTTKNSKQMSSVIIVPL
jgi:hypothetical protein